MADGELNETRMFVVSRCAMTLYRFRGNLVRGLQQRGARVTVLGARGESYEDKLRSAGLDFRHVPVPLRSVAPLADARLVLDLFRRFRREKPAVVHAFTIKPAIFATLAARMAGVPVKVVTITGLGYAFTSAGGLLRRLVEWLYRIALAQADVVFFQNPLDRRLFLERGLVSERKAQLVEGSGVDTERFAPTPLPYQSGAAPVFLMIARLLRDKGVLEYQQAASQVRRQFPGARFLLLGGEDPRNPSRLNSEELAKLRACPDLELLDEVEDVRPTISRADVMVLPSYREGLPRSLLEGGAMGRAMIATDVPGCCEVVTHERNGLLVPCADGDALGSAMLRLCENPDLIDGFGAAARSGIEARFDERKVIDNTVATYLRLLLKNAKHPKKTSSN